MLSDFIVNLNDYEVVKSLGEGSSGVVQLVKFKASEKLFAAKTFKHELENTQQQQSFFREIESFSKVKNPAVLSLIGFSLLDFKKQHLPTIITNYMPKGSLDRMILNKYNFTSSQKYIILLGIAEGMKYLHSISIAHRDLKPANILIDDNFYPYICDFGESRFFNSKTQTDLMETFTGSLLYMAPEILSEDLYTNKVDVYSFAISAYQIITGKYVIYDDIGGKFKFMKKVRDGMRPDLKFVENELIKNLLVNCWSNDPLERPTFDEILNEIKSEKFMKSMNANKSDVSKYLELFNENNNNNKKTKQEHQLSNGIYYLVSTSNGEIASVINKNSISCSNLSLRSSLEFFNLINNSDGTISLKSEANGFYVGVSPDKGFHLIAKSQNIQSFEKFNLIPSTDSVFLIQSKSNNKYVTVDQTDNCIMKATSDKKSSNSFAFYPVKDKSKGTFDMKTKEISFEGKTYKYIDEYIRSGSQLDSELKLLEQKYDRVYPQGIEYVKKLVIKQKEAKRTLIIFGFSQNSKYTLFYFPFNKITELSCDQGFRVFGNDEFDKEINLLHLRKDSCSFPQSWKHCLSFLENEKKIGGCVRIANRCGDVPVFYFFKVNTNDNEDKNLLTYEYERWYENNELNDLLNSLNNYKLPQGIEYCRDIIQRRRDNGGKIHGIECRSTKTALFFKA